jgi:hypothetical protein
MLELERTTEPQVTIVPYRIRLRLCELLEAEGIPYEQICQDEPDAYLDGWSGRVTYCGKIYTNRNYAFVTTVTPESLFKAAENMRLMGPKEIHECVDAHKKSSNLNA